MDPVTRRGKVLAAIREDLIGDATLALASCGITIPLPDLYAGL
jgi:hypothetical protein